MYMNMSICVYVYIYIYLHTDMSTGGLGVLGVFRVWVQGSDCQARCLVEAETALSTSTLHRFCQPQLGIEGSREYDIV